MERKEQANMLNRRHVAAGALLLGGAAATVHSPAVAREEGPIAQPASPTSRNFVERAFAMRDLAVSNGDQGYGALIVDGNGKIVGQAPSRVVTNSDPTAHAEMEAIRDAAKRLRTRNLSNHVMYSSSRPCPMCEAAAYWANVKLMYYGRAGDEAGEPRLCR